MMMMMLVTISGGLIGFLCFAFTAGAPTTAECDKSLCPGPLQLYDEIKCQPIYNNPQDCCPARFHCDFITRPLSADKCYANGEEFKAGASISKCDEACECKTSWRTHQIKFSCYDDLRILPLVDANCYLPRNAVDCQPVREICTKDPETIHKCDVDGRIYKHGEMFIPAKGPRKTCYCHPEYRNENIEPFCVKTSCHKIRDDRDEFQTLRSLCAPVYRPDESLENACPYAWICFNPTKDLMTKRPQYAYSSSTTNASRNRLSNDLCLFGNITMEIGDETNRTINGSMHVIKCTCEVPPLPTCIDHSSSIVDQTLH